MSVEPKRAAILVISVLVASFVLVGVSLAEPEIAQAAGGGYVDTCRGDRIFLKEKEKRTLALHNDERRQRNLPTFCVDSRLQKAARAHSKDMIRRDYFSHNTKGKGESFDERLKRYGYRFQVGENIAYGSGPYGEPESRMDAWMRSDGHRHNILHPEFREIGIGTHTGTWRGYNGITMYTVDFGVGRG